MILDVIAVIITTSSLISLCLIIAIVIFQYPTFTVHDYLCAGCLIVAILAIGFLAIMKYL